jgi:hypothetical protein
MEEPLRRLFDASRGGPTLVQSQRKLYDLFLVTENQVMGLQFDSDYSGGRRIFFPF